jgi:aspartate dehydrogenase
LIVSVGALAERSLEEKLLSAGPGNLIICTGALGGIDYIQAAKLLGKIDEISLTSTKKPGVLAQHWMEDSLKEKLAAGNERIVVFEGNAREAAEAFPKSSNVSATLALTIGSWDMVKVKVVGDPSAKQTKHQVKLSGDVGESEFEVNSLPSAVNPATSSVVPFSVVKALRIAHGSGYKIM